MARELLAQDVAGKSPGLCSNACLLLARAGLPGDGGVVLLTLLGSACSGTAPADRTARDTVDTGSTRDTGQTGAGGVTFTDLDGQTSDWTEFFTLGTATTWSTDGTLAFGPGDWFVRLAVTADDLHITGAGRDATTLSGGEQGTVVRVVGGELTLTDVTIDRGRALGAGNEARGGGLFCDEGAELTLERLTLSNNRAYDGGALFATDCTVEGDDLLFTGNRADDDGGAIAVYSDGALTFTNTTFSGGSARDGGAVFLWGGTLSLVDGRFDANVASDKAGGLLNYQSQVSLVDVQFTDNESGGGGAIHSAGHTDLERVTFSGNVAPLGGGLLVFASATTRGVACVFQGNEPDDVNSSVGSYVFPEVLDFFCDSNGCVEE